MRHIHFGTRAVCTYCGDTANSIDHCYAPVASQTNQKRHGAGKTKYGATTNACTDCNCYLSDRRFDSFWDRCAFVQQRLENKAKPIIWTAEQIRQLDASLSSVVKRETAKRKWLRMRADFFQSREFCVCCDSLVWEELPPEYERYFATTKLFVLQVTRW